MKQNLAPAYWELKIFQFTASQSSGVMNFVHGDISVHLSTPETKTSGSHLKAGFIKNAKTFNTWIRTKHIAADIQHVLNQVLKIQISKYHTDVFK